MTRSTLPAAVALAVSAALLLTACGGGSDSSDQIQPSATASTSASASASTPATAAVPAAPVFDLPSGLTVKFEGFDSTDPTKKAVLTDATYALTSVLEFKSVMRARPTPNFTRFFTGENGTEYSDNLVAQFWDGKVITGSDHFYQPVVTSGAGGNMSVQLCEDQRKAYAKDVTTSQVIVTTPSPADFRQWTLRMSKSSSGEWHVVDHTETESVKSCELN